MPRIRGAISAIGAEQPLAYSTRSFPGLVRNYTACGATDEGSTKKTGRSANLPDRSIVRGCIAETRNGNPPG